MLIIPAIDILDNEAVRLYRGDYSQKTVYSKEPWSLVEAFSKTGASLVHIIDLNGAKTAESTNKETIAKIRKSSTVKIQLGGGIRNMEKLKYYESLGIDRFIVGTAAVNDPSFVEEALKFVGAERFVVSVDALHGFVKIIGWSEDTKMHYDDLLKRIISQGVTEVVFTDISQDGTLSGPNLESYKHILNNYDINLIASGGIASLKDIIALSSLKTSKHLFGIITGKAIYEGKLDLKEAIYSTKK